MEWVNITAKSLPEAIDLALDNLGVDESEAEIVVLEEPKQGLFGRIRGTARVKARVKPRSTRPKIERGRRKRRGENAAASRDGDAERSSEGRTGRSRNRTRGKKRGEVEAGSKDSGQASEGHESDVRDRSRNGSETGGGRSSKKQRREETPVEEASMEEVGAQLEAFLHGLTEAFGYNGAVTVSEDDEGGVVASVEGQHGLMVGPKGRTLDAIQELARVAAQRTAPSSVRIKVDVGGYRGMRQVALEKFALEAAGAARSDGKERSLEPMSSADRKIVHDALSDVPGVETRSAGSEPRRRVVVVPIGAEAPSGDDPGDGEVPGYAEAADETTLPEGTGPAGDAGGAGDTEVEDAELAGAAEDAGETVTAGAGRVGDEPDLAGEAGTAEDAGTAGEPEGAEAGGEPEDAEDAGEPETAEDAEVVGN